jgi:hypothetical protein
VRPVEGTVANTLLPSYAVKRLFNQLPGKEADVVLRCLEEVTRAAKRVKHCSRAASERALGAIRDQQRIIRHNTNCLPRIEILTEDMAKTVRQLEDRIQAQQSPGTQSELCPPAFSVTLNCGKTCY